MLFGKIMGDIKAMWCKRKHRRERYKCLYNNTKMATAECCMKQMVLVPSTVSLAADSTPSSTTILYVSASCTSHWRTVSMCFVPTLVHSKRSMSLISCGPLNHLGLTFGLDTSHSNTAVSNSVTFLSLSGVRNSAGASVQADNYVISNRPIKEWWQTHQTSPRAGSVLYCGIIYVVL